MRTLFSYLQDKSSLFSQSILKFYYLYMYFTIMQYSHINNTVKMLSRQNNKAPTALIMLSDFVCIMIKMKKNLL